MKPLTFAILFIVSTASAQWENDSKAFSRWPIRIVGGHRTDLSTLYIWWTNGMNILARHRDGRGGLHLPRGMTVQQLLPEPPVTNWCRVLGTNFQAHALGWVVKGEILESPGMRRACTFILRRAPAAEKKRFEEERNEMWQLVHDGHVSIATQEFVDVQGNRWLNAPNGFVGLGPEALEHAQRISNDLAKMPPGDIWRLDCFATKIGVTQDAATWRFGTRDIGIS
jgi:hypothetical protein